MNTFTQWCSRQEGTLKAVQLPFKTYNLRSDLSLITVSNADMRYSEETLALALIFTLKISKNEMHFLPCVFPDHTSLWAKKDNGEQGNPDVLLGQCALSSPQAPERTREGYGLEQAL